MNSKQLISMLEFTQVYVSHKACRYSRSLVAIVGPQRILIELYPDSDGLSCSTIQAKCNTVYYTVPLALVLQVLTQAKVWVWDRFQSLFSLFSRVSIFSNVSAYARALAAALATKERVKAASLVVRQSALHYSFNVVISGEVCNCYILTV